MLSLESENLNTDEKKIEAEKGGGQRVILEREDSRNGNAPSLLGANNRITTLMTP